MRDSGGLSAWPEVAAFDKNRQVVVRAHVNSMIW
jgi:hypothetical protein